MTYLYSCPEETTGARGPRSRRPAHRPSRDGRVRRSFDGVVASYIRDISLRRNGHDRATPHVALDRS